MRIGKHIYKFSLSRELEGNIETMTLKRDAIGDFFICLCGYYNKGLMLREREWECSGCGKVLHRDRNASYNILRAGASAQGLGDIRPSLKAVSA